MKNLIVSILVLSAVGKLSAQMCATCGQISPDMGMSGDVGVHCSISLGSAQYGESAGHLVINSSNPSYSLYTPAALSMSENDRSDVEVFTTNVITTNTTMVTQITVVTLVQTNILCFTNYAGDDPSTATTNISFDTNFIVSTMFLTNNSMTVSTSSSNQIRQVIAPETIADIPQPQTTNGFVINLYYPSQVSGYNADGSCQLIGSPFISWIVTNLNSGTANQLQVSEFGNVPYYGIMKQWTYSYLTNTGSWAVDGMGNLVEEDVTTTNLGQGIYGIINTVESPGGPAVQQMETIFAPTIWGTLPVELISGAANNPKITSYIYSNGRLLQVIYPNGSWQYYQNYDLNGNPLVVYSSYGNLSAQSFNSSARAETDYTYDSTNAGVSASGDNGTLYPNTARLTVQKIQGAEVSRQYTVFPSEAERLDITCLVAGALWNASGNLVTTNIFYTNGPNQFCLQAIIHPDGTMDAYNYITNGLYKTNITVTGQPDAGYNYIVDGVSNQVILNQWGYTVGSTSWDVKSGLLLVQDVYGNFDNYGRPQQVTHLDGTTEYTEYACCGVDETIDRDGVVTQYLYDQAHRQTGYDKVYNSTPITYSNVLDAANRTVANVRIGSDNTSIATGQSAYDTAGRLIAQTNALNGGTIYVETTNSLGALVRITTYPDSGTRIETNNLDGSLQSITGSGVHGVGYIYGTGTDVNGNRCRTTEEVKLNANGSNTSEATTTFTDMAGRITEVLYAGGHYSQSFYNNQGQLCKQVDPDGVTTIYQYNAKGELTVTAISATGSGATSPSFGGSDRITAVTNDVLTEYGTTVRRTQNYAWLNTGSSTSALVSKSETSATGTDTWQTSYRDTGTPIVTHAHTSVGTSKTVTTVFPDNSYSLDSYSYSLLLSHNRYDSGNNQICGTSYGYDAHFRQNSITDARDGITTYCFNNADQIVTNTTPNPGGVSPEVTTTVYDTMLRPCSIIQPDNTTVTSSYLLTGELGLQSGSKTYPVAYSYDYAGRMMTMTNWSSFGTTSGARVTTWKYDGYRGWLTNKVYDGNSPGPIYQYTSAGRLYKRTWARNVTTTYGYDFGGLLDSATYSDSTPGVTTTYDRLGRKSSISWNGITDTLTNNLANQLTSESFSGGNLNGLTITNVYDSDLRRATLTALKGGSLILAGSFGYDAASRLSSVSDQNNNSATYSYLANSMLVSQITFKQNGTTRMTTTKQYDNLNRLTQISSAPSASYVLPLTYNYNYNPANQRTKDTLADGSYWVYGYDSLGQVTNACKYWASGSPVAGQQFDYTFDTIGNRTQAQAGGDTNGLNLRVANYSANNLNQITQRDVPPYVDVIGASILTNSVTVNGQTAYRNQEYFRQQVPANNTNSALWTNIIVAGGQSVTGNVYVAQEPETLKYDLDGNLTNDGRWAYVWDGENRLIQMTVNTNIGPQYKLSFAYDPQGRRIQKIVSTNGVTIYTDNFLYDGWNLIATLSSSSALINSFMWGSDLSGSVQGAGGVGGLLEMSYYGTATTNCFPAYDGNGNITALVNAADGTLAADYEYGAFGEPIRITGTMGKNNPFRFSTKYDDDESDLLYYGYRFYKPSTGTWPNRDLIGELGGINLYGFVANNPVNLFDPYGNNTKSPFFTVSLYNGHYDTQAGIIFHAGNGCQSCKNVKLAQIVYTIQEGLGDHLITPERWRLDTDGAHSPWYPYQQSNGPGVVSMTDDPGIRGLFGTPGLWPDPNQQIYGVTQLFETGAICLDDKPYVIGTVSWGQQVGGLRSASSWGSGDYIPAVPPSAIFSQLTGFH